MPQLYVKGEFVGGCDIVREMYQSGELAELLRGQGRRRPKPPPDRPAAGHALGQRAASWQPASPEQSCSSSMLPASVPIEDAQPQRQQALIVAQQELRLDPVVVDRDLLEIVGVGPGEEARALSASRTTALLAAGDPGAIAPDHLGLEVVAPAAIEDLRREGLALVGRRDVVADLEERGQRIDHVLAQLLRAPCCRPACRAW